jgi:hemin uptake protein HemP
MSVFSGYRKLLLVIDNHSHYYFQQVQFIIYKKMSEYHKYTSINHPPRPSSTNSHQSLESRDLLQGRDQVEILHRGETYRLRITRQGKLILTK